MKDDAMAWAIFNREFNFRRPKSRLSFNVKPSELPQERPHDVVEAAVAAGAATSVPSPAREVKPAKVAAKRAK